MTDDEVHERIRTIDGVQKAQLVVLRALLRSSPDALSRVQGYADHLQSTGGDPSLEKDVNDALIATLLQLSR